jgi:hypothetical protein
MPPPRQLFSLIRSPAPLAMRSSLRTSRPVKCSRSRGRRSVPAHQTSAAVRHPRVALLHQGRKAEGTGAQRQKTATECDGRHRRYLAVQAICQMASRVPVMALHARTKEDALLTPCCQQAPARQNLSRATEP